MCRGYACAVLPLGLPSSPMHSTRHLLWCSLLASPSGSDSTRALPRPLTMTSFPSILNGPEACRGSAAPLELIRMLLAAAMPALDLGGAAAAASST